MQKANIRLIILVLLNYFTFMFISNIAGILLGYWKTDFHLTQFLASTLAAVPFIAYGMTSLPQGILLSRIGNKTLFLIAVCCVMAGSITFATFPSLTVGIPCLFLIGIGIVGLQIVGNLLEKA